MSIRPLHDRVLVERNSTEERTKSGLYIPDSAKEKPVQGKIIAVGAGKKLESGETLPLDVKVGDVVLFGKYSGTEVTVGEQELLVLKEEDIMGVIEG